MRNPLHRIRRVATRALTVSNVLATLAVFVACSGTAFAVKQAVTYTGVHVRNETLMGADFKNLSLGTTQFSASTTRALAVKGPAGDLGPQGAQGDTGPAGYKGADGVPAPKAYTFQTVTQSTRIRGRAVNPSIYDTMDCNTASDLLVNCPTFSIATPDGQLRFPRWNYQCEIKHCYVGAISVPRMTRSDQALIVTSANPSGGLLTMPYDGTILLNAAATFFTQRTDSQQRLECQLQLGRVENGTVQQTINVGVPMTIYRHVEGNGASAGALNRQERLLNISVTGAVAQSSGVFETQLSCRSLDDSGDPNDRLEFIEGNMSALSTRTNGQA